MAQHAVCTTEQLSEEWATADDSDAAADELSRRTIDELCEEWKNARDADAAGELADELAKRALDVRDPEDVARLCSAIVARLNGSHDNDDEIAAVLDAVTCGPLGTPGARGDALRRETLVFPGGVAWGLNGKFHGPALRAACAEFLFACARRDAERAGPAVRLVAETVADPYSSRETCLSTAADPASRRLRALVAAFGPAAPSYEYVLRRRRVPGGDIDHLLRVAARKFPSDEACEIAERLGSLLGRDFFERDWEARCVWRRADGSGGARSCFRGSSPALAAPRWPAAAANSGDEPAPPPAKRARRGEGQGPLLEDVESLCAGRIAGASSIDRARGRGDALAEDFALELLDDDRPPLDGVDFYRVGGSTVVLNADARWRICAQCRDAVQRRLHVACSVNLYATPAGATTLEPHADDHCVFVAQLSGAKLWRIFLDGEQFPDLGATLPRPADDANSFFVTLYAGDILYVPRGAPHVCRALDGEPSVHVSIGIDLDPTLTWLSALQTFVSKARGDRHSADLVEAARAAPELRGAVLPALSYDFDEGMRAARKRAAGALEALGRSAAAAAVRAEPSELRCAAVSDSLAHRVRVALEQSRAVTTLLRCKSLINYFPGPFFRPAFFFRGPAAFSIFFST